MSPFFLSYRYSFSSSNRHRLKAVKIAIGMLFSTLALLVTLSVMDYLQNTRFAALKSVKSFPIVIESSSSVDLGDIPHFVYKEMPALLTSQSFSQAVMVRFVDENYQGGLPDNSLSLLQQGALVGITFNGKLSEDVKLSYLDTGKAVTRTIKNIPLNISGYYRTRLGSSFDNNYIFLPLSLAPEYLNEKIAILDESDELISSLKANGYSFTTWQEAEATLYDAMMMERLLMIFIISFLFLIILVQINTNARLFIEVKKGEIITLWTLGLSKQKCAISFALSGFIVSFLGCFLGYIFSFPLLRLIPSILSLPLYTTLSPDFSLALLSASLMAFLSALLYYKKSIKVMRQSEEVLHE